ETIMLAMGIRGPLPLDDTWPLPTELDDLSRVPARDHIGRHMIRHHTPSGDDAALPNFDAWQHDAIGPNPDVVFDCHGFSGACRIDTFCHVIERKVVPAAIYDLAIGGYQAVISYRDAPIGMNAGAVNSGVVSNSNNGAGSIRIQLHRGVH